MLFLFFSCFGKDLYKFLMRTPWQRLMHRWWGYLNVPGYIYATATAGISGIGSREFLGWLPKTPRRTVATWYCNMGVNPKICGFLHQTHGFFLEMIMTWGCLEGTIIEGNTHILQYHLSVWGSQLALWEGKRTRDHQVTLAILTGDGDQLISYETPGVERVDCQDWVLQWIGWNKIFWVQSPMKQRVVLLQNPLQTQLLWWMTLYDSCNVANMLSFPHQSGD